MAYRKTETEAQKYWRDQMLKVISEYEHKYKFYSTKETPAYCYIDSKEIYIPESYWKYPYSKYAFDVYHEIGHLETNSLDMEAYQQEYLATVWAIHAMNERRLYIAPRTFSLYQKYIAGYRDNSVDRDAVSDEDIALPAALNVGFNRNTARVINGDGEPCVMDLVSYLKSRNVEFVDNRMKGGNLTIVGTEPNIGELINTICLAYGITGRYGSSLRAIKHRAGWWTQGRRAG